MQAGEFADVAHGQYPQQALEPGLQTSSQAGSRLQPMDPFGNPPTTTQAVDATHGQLNWSSTR